VRSAISLGPGLAVTADWIAEMLAREGYRVPRGDRYSTSPIRLRRLGQWFPHRNRPHVATAGGHEGRGHHGRPWVDLARGRRTRRRGHRHTSGPKPPFRRHRGPRHAAPLGAALEDSSASRRVNTSFEERQNGTDRGRNARKTYRFSKGWQVHEAM